MNAIIAWLRRRWLFSEHWAQIVIGILLGIVLLTLIAFAVGVAGFHHAIPWIILAIFAGVAVIVQWRPAVLLALAAPYGVGTRVGRFLAVFFVSMILLAFAGGFVPWEAKREFGPWFILAAFGLAFASATRATPYLRFARKAFILILIGLAVAVYHYAGTLHPLEKLGKKVVENTTDSFNEIGVSPICYDDGCLGARYIAGDGVTSLSYEVYHLAGQQKYYTGRFTVERKGGQCSGHADLESTGDDTGTRWQVTIEPVSCESLSRFDSTAQFSSPNQKAQSAFYFRKG